MGGVGRKETTMPVKTKIKKYRSNYIKGREGMGRETAMYVI